MKCRELQNRVSELFAGQGPRQWAAIIGLEKLIFKYKIESLTIQGVYSEIDDGEDKPLHIIFEEIDGRTGRQIGRGNNGQQENESDREPEEDGEASDEGNALLIPDEEDPDN